jgi:DNA-binding Lrp family transcriptional regulator
MKAIIGGIFGTHTEVNTEGNVTKKDDFHLRIYWDLFRNGSIKKLKGNMLHAYLLIAMYADNSGKGWPTQEILSDMLGVSRNTVGTAVKHLEKEGFITREKVRTSGKFDNTIYKIKAIPEKPEVDQSHAQDLGTVETAENQALDHAQEFNMVTMPNFSAPSFQHDKLGTKEDSSFKKELSFKKDLNTSMYVCTAGPELASVDLFKNNYDLTKYAKENLESFSMKHGEELTLYAVQKTIKNISVTNPISYIKTTLENWSEWKLTTLEAVLAHEQSFWAAKGAPKQKKGNQQQGKPNTYAKSNKTVKKLPATIAREIVVDVPTDEETKAIYDDIFATINFLRSTEKQVLHQKDAS